MLLEHFGEVTLRTERQRVRNIIKRIIGLGKQSLGHFDPALRQVAQKGLAGLTLEDRRKVCGSQSETFCNRIKSYLLIEMRIQKINAGQYSLGIHIHLLERPDYIYKFRPYRPVDLVNP